jgi:PIN domain nuclease of toxin-antitoxin system
MNCGAEGWADVERFGKKKKEWFARFLQLQSDIPSHDTFGRVLALPGSFHNDPADQIIVATARTHGSQLVTMDRRILAYPHGNVARFA